MSPCLKLIQQRESGSTKDTRNLLHRPHVQSLEKDFVFLWKLLNPMMRIVASIKQQTVREYIIYLWSEPSWFRLYSIYKSGIYTWYFLDLGGSQYIGLVYQCIYNGYFLLSTISFRLSDNVDLLDICPSLSYMSVHCMYVWIHVSANSLSTPVCICKYANQAVFDKKYYPLNHPQMFLLEDEFFFKAYLHYNVTKYNIDWCPIWLFSISTVRWARCHQCRWCLWRRA